LLSLKCFIHRLLLHAWLMHTRTHTHTHTHIHTHAHSYIRTHILTFTLRDVHPHDILALSVINQLRISRRDEKQKQLIVERIIDATAPVRPARFFCVFLTAGAHFVIGTVHSCARRSFIRDLFAVYSCVRATHLVAACFAGLISLWCFRRSCARLFAARTSGYHIWC